VEQLLTIVIGSISGFIAALSQGWFDRLNQLDQSLTEHRSTVYSKLWTMTGEISKYPRNLEFSPSDAANLMNKLRKWYFEEHGGLYMSAATQKRYIAFQAALDSFSKSDENDAKVCAKHYDTAQSRGSALRTGMTRDLRSRRAAIRV
jgi:hypothetical protein